jgi:hypothetical protein
MQNAVTRKKKVTITAYTQKPKAKDKDFVEHPSHQPPHVTSRHVTHASLRRTDTNHSRRQHHPHTAACEPAADNGTPHLAANSDEEGHVEPREENPLLRARTESGRRGEIRQHGQRIAPPPSRERRKREKRHYYPSPLAAWQGGPEWHDYFQTFFDTQSPVAT